VKQASTTSLPKVRAWLESVASRTGAFEVLEGLIEAREESARWDEAVTIRPQGSPQFIRLLLESKLRLHPQHAVAVADRLRQDSSLNGPNVLAVVAAPYISQRVAEICRGNGVGYIDAAGNCHLAAPGFYLHVEGQRNQRPDTRPAENLFAPKSSRVVRALVEHPERSWRVQDLAGEVGVSMGLASRIKHKLIQQAFAEEVPEGIRVSNAAALLEQWAEVYTNRARAVPVYSMDDAGALERRVSRWCADHSVQCALAEFSAAARLSPMVRYKRAAVYIEEPRSREVLAPLMRELDLKEVDSGASAVLWVTQDDSVFYNATERDGLTTVSPVQAYLDLVKNPARGGEAADELLRRLILPRLHSGRAIAP